MLRDQRILLTRENDGQNFPATLVFETNEANQTNFALVRFDSNNSELLLSCDGIGDDAGDWIVYLASASFSVVNDWRFTMELIV